MKVRKPDNRTLGLIFTGLAMAGVPITATLSAMRAPKYKEILSEYEDPETKEVKTVDKVKAGLKTQWPAAIAGALTCAFIALAEKLNLTEIAGLVTTCGFLVKNRDKLEQKILEYTGKEEGDKILKQIKKEVNEDMVKEVYVRSAGPSVEETGRGDLLCYEAYSGRWFRSSELAVEKAVERLNSMFAEDQNYVCLNDFYDELGIERTHFGHQWGWTPNEDYYVGPIAVDTCYCKAKDIMDRNPSGQLEALDEDVLIIEILTYPMEGWEEV